MGKSLLVIGASSDMAMDSIREIHSEYDSIIAHYRRMNETLMTLKKELADRLILLQADLVHESAVGKLIFDIRETHLNPSHILHFPAPPCINQRFHKMPYEAFSQELDISLRSAVLILQNLLPQMAKEKYGRIVFMLSFVLRDIPPKYCSQYVVAKYALLGLMKSLAAEYADKGITVNGISPAWVMTKYLDTQPAILVEQNAKENPIGRNLRTDDLIPTLSWLLSDGAQCVTGQNVYITGGR